MNKRTGWENEATTRAINAQPWEPPPGMVKQQCPDCRYCSPLRSTEPSNRAVRIAWTSCRVGTGGDQGRTHRGTRRQQPASAAGGC